MFLSVIICTHEPRAEYLRRTLDGLKAQTLPLNEWELLLVDNGSRQRLETLWDLSWHPHGRHVWEEELGLTPARLRGIAEAEGDLLVFADDDNVFAPDYLERAAAIPDSHPHLGVFGAGALEPEFEVEPDGSVRPLLQMLALRTFRRPLWTNNIADYACAPHGAGLCVPRYIASLYRGLVNDLRTSSVLDRKGQQLFCGGDDLFSWLSAGNHAGFGVFPELRITHLISAGRVNPEYFVRLIHGHRFSHTVLDYMLTGRIPLPVTLLQRVRALAHGLVKGMFSMRCRFAEFRAQAEAVHFIAQQSLQPLAPDKQPVSRAEKARNEARMAALNAPAFR